MASKFSKRYIFEYDKKIQGYRNLGRFATENDVYFFFYHTFRKWRNGFTPPIDLVYQISYLQNGCDEELKKAAQQGVQLTAFGANWRYRFAKWLISIAYRIAPFGGN
ncbi:MAG: hypothetical protein FJZ86_18315 [Chloroflexi bacterium]|nr:hypothetical protein [Chloroflexota bacterium]